MEFSKDVWWYVAEPADGAAPSAQHRRPRLCWAPTACRWTSGSRCNCACGEWRTRPRRITEQQRRLTAYASLGLGDHVGTDAWSPISVQSIVFSVNSAVFSVKPIVFSIQSIICSVLSIICRVNSIVYSAISITVSAESIFFRSKSISFSATSITPPHPLPSNPAPVDRSRDIASLDNSLELSVYLPCHRPEWKLILTACGSLARLASPVSDRGACLNRYALSNSDAPLTSLRERRVRAERVGFCRGPRDCAKVAADAMLSAHEDVRLQGDILMMLIPRMLLTPLPSSWWSCSSTKEFTP